MHLIRTVDIQIILRKYFRTVVNGISRTVEYPSQHVLGHRQLHATSSELDMRRLDINTRCTLKDLHDGFLALDLENLATTL